MAHLGYWTRYRMLLDRVYATAHNRDACFVFFFFIEKKNWKVYIQALFQQTIYIKKIRNLFFTVHSVELNKTQHQSQIRLHLTYSQNKRTESTPHLPRSVILHCPCQKYKASLNLSNLFKSSYHFRCFKMKCCCDTGMTKVCPNLVRDEFSSTVHIYQLEG